jgi:hypothetical protein
MDAEKPGRMPGEFEKIDALMLGVNELVELHPRRSWRSSP